MWVGYPFGQTADTLLQALGKGTLGYALVSVRHIKVSIEAARIRLNKAPTETIQPVAALVDLKLGKPCWERRRTLGGAL
jgi:hypothetical protein